MKNGQVKQINHRTPVGPYRAKHIFLEEREADAAQEFGQEQADRDERLETHYNRRERSPLKRK